MIKKIDYIVEAIKETLNLVMTLVGLIIATLTLREVRNKLQD